jgi:hypothetical protein
MFAKGTPLTRNAAELLCAFRVLVEAPIAGDEACSVRSGGGDQDTIGRIAVEIAGKRGRSCGD